jgi:DNA-3-methyladenine glycosylase II
MLVQNFDEHSLPLLCKKLAKHDVLFARLLKENGVPPFWNRSNSFATLIHIILEQQVSLASAKAAFDKLKQKLGTVTPKKLLALSDAELKACYFSRQKTVYAKHLATAFETKQINLKQLAVADEETIRQTLTAIKGIGHWTVDVYLMMCLQRIDLFPLGDIALVNSMKHELNLPKTTTKEELQAIALQWQPYRTIASFMFWWAYIKRKNLKVF